MLGAWIFLGAGIFGAWILFAAWAFGGWTSGILIVDRWILGRWVFGVIDFGSGMAFLAPPATALTDATGSVAPF
jgi:hypothetical protein